MIELRNSSTYIYDYQITTQLDIMSYDMWIFYEGLSGRLLMRQHLVDVMRGIK